MANLAKSSGGDESRDQHHEGFAAKEIELSEHPSTVTSKVSSGPLCDEFGALEEQDSKSTNSEQDEEKAWFEQYCFRLLQRWGFLVLVGFLAVSYWRGLWSLFDIYSCGQPGDNALFDGGLFCFGQDLSNRERRHSALLSWGLGLLLTTIGKLLFWAGCFDDKSGSTTRIRLGGTRIVMVQSMGMGSVFIWRGVWMLTDDLMYPENTLRSGWTAVSLGFAGCLLLFCSASLCAAPTGLLQDPSRESFETIGSGLSNQMDQAPSESRTSKAQFIFGVADITASYVMSPIFGVWTWRGIWILQDGYLWGYTASTSDFAWSLWIGSVIFSTFVALNRVLDISIVSLSRDRSLPSVLLLPTTRLQNLFLGVASVSFWRVMWYAWEHITGPSLLSAWIAHLLGLMGLLILGVFANATFPPATDLLRTNHCTSQTQSESRDEALAVGLRWFGIFR